MDRFNVLLFLKLCFSIWFVHPYFSGYEHVYSLVVDRFILPHKDRIQEYLNYLHDMQYRYLTFAIQYIMNFFDSCVKQVNELVRYLSYFIIYRSRRSLQVSILNNHSVCCITFQSVSKGTIYHLRPNLTLSNSFHPPSFHFTSENKSITNNLHPLERDITDNKCCTCINNPDNQHNESHTMFGEKGGRQDP